MAAFFLVKLNFPTYFGSGTLWKPKFSGILFFFLSSIKTSFQLIKAE